MGVPISATSTFGSQVQTLKESVGAEADIFRCPMPGWIRGKLLAMPPLQIDAGMMAVLALTCFSYWLGGHVALPCRAIAHYQGVNLPAATQ